MLDPNMLDKLIRIVQRRTKNRELYLSKQEKNYEKLRKVAKVLHDLTVKQGEFSRRHSLLIDCHNGGISAQGIWQQLELQNKVFFNHAIKELSKFKTRKRFSKKLVEIGLDQDEFHDSSMCDETEYEFNGDSKMEYTNKHKNENNLLKKFGTTVVDDRFFKLNELEEYLTQEDHRHKRLEGKKNSIISDDSDENTEDNNSYDYFKELSDNSQDGEARLMKYKDFFDRPRSDMTVCFDQKDNQETSHVVKEVKFNLEKINNEANEHKSTLESRQERMQKKIANLEKQAVSEKPWQLNGEISGMSRPQNSLLEEFVEFDMVPRPAPVVTEQTALKLENIIRIRIKDNVWNDVLRTVKPIEIPKEYKKKLVMNQERSKESLAQIYENEFVKQREGVGNDRTEEKLEAEPLEHSEIRQTMHLLFRKLDALSNFYFTPRASKAELNIISNLPAVSMEEVAPVAISEATRLAPEEVKGKDQGDLIGQSKRAKTDTKRKRGMKKINRSACANEKHQEVSMGGLTKKKQPKNSELINNLKKQQNIIHMDSIDQKTTQAIKSSTAFFTQLQDEVRSSIKAKTAKSVIGEINSSLPAMRLKY